MRQTFLAPLCALLLAAGSSAPAQTPVGPTVQDVVEFTRIVEPRSREPEAIQQQLSPDGTRVFIVVRKPSVSSDMNRYEIQLLHLTPARLSERRPTSPEVVFAFETEQDSYDLDPAIQQVQWWDDRSLTFMGRLKDGIQQVYRLDLPTRELVQVTRGTTPVVSFAASKDLRRIVYAAQVPNPPLKDGARSIVIGNQSFWSVKTGQDRLAGQIRKYRFYVTDSGSSQQPRPLGEPFFESNYAKPRASISPDGRWALLPRYESPEKTIAWSRQYSMVNELLKEYGQPLRADPLFYFSSPHTFVARRVVAWRLDDGREQDVVDAPDDALAGVNQTRVDKIWQGNGTSVVLAGTHLPITPGGRASTASHVIEYWPDTGRWAVIATLAGRLDDARPRVDGFELTDSGKRRVFRRIAGAAWHEVSGPTPASEGAAPVWSPRIEEGLNEPPDVYAKGPAGEMVRLTTLNPQFNVKTWGTVKPYTWRDAKNRQWQGGLLEGEGTVGRSKLPLVIQAYAFSSNRFFLDGPNTWYGGTSAFAGRAFAREGVLVLMMGFRPMSGPVSDDYKKLRQFNEGVRGAVNALVKAGRVDPARVGIIGWSTTGETVLNLLTFSDLPIRAATLADGDANSLFAYTVTYGINVWDHVEAMNNAAPFGPKLADWVRNDPALNTDCVRSALRIESYGVPMYNNYDLYTLLRRQYKPVEMILIPGGNHSLSRPSERMLSLQGNVDWFRFWLKGERRTVPMLAGETGVSLQAQYEAWQQMEAMKAKVDAVPRCSRAASLG